MNKDIPPGKLAVGMPARVIRDAPEKKSKENPEGGDLEQPKTKMEG